MTFGTILMIDPVVASDGHTYERESIEQWMTSHDASPTTSQPLEHKILIPNHLVRKQVVSWCEKNCSPVPKVPKRPVAKAVAGGGAAAPLVQKPVVMCELHPKEQLRVFCVNCNRAVCFMCAVDIDMCKSHDIKAFDPLIEELKTDIEGWARAQRKTTAPAAAVRQLVCLSLGRTLASWCRHRLELERTSALLPRCIPAARAPSLLYPSSALQ